MEGLPNPQAEVGADEDPLVEEIASNYSAGLEVDESRPTCIPSSLARAIIQDFPACYMGHMKIAEASTETRFLSTLGVFCCIAVVACSQPRKVGFMSHINSQSLKPGLDSCGKPLLEVAAAMKRCFASAALADVEVHVIGGHRRTDKIGPLSRYFPDDTRKHFFSSHVLDMLSDAGFTNVNTKMLNAFEGSSDIRDYTGPHSVHRLRENKRFVIVALDLLSGAIVTHTRSPGGFARECFGDDWHAIQAEFDREERTTRMEARMRQRGLNQGGGYGQGGVIIDDASA